VQFTFYSAHPYIMLSDEKPVVEHNPVESLVFLSVSVDAYPSSWTVQWFKDDVPIPTDHPRLTATYVSTLHAFDEWLFIRVNSHKPFLKE